MERREFIQLVPAAIIGVVAGAVLPEPSSLVNKVVKDTTGHPTGNAAFRDHIQEQCKNSDDQDCLRNYEPSTALKLMAVVVAPVREEALFRALPAAFLSELDDEDPSEAVVFGTESSLTTRREFGVSVLTSILFGLSHNLTSQGIDTRTIPASQITTGVIYWYMQRKLGVISNTLAHMVFNLRAIW